MEVSVWPAPHLRMRSSRKNPFGTDSALIVEVEAEVQERLRLHAEAE